jgi:deazaflavin-dependent oxidoreductase (nitroreductase family)
MNAVHNSVYRASRGRIGKSMQGAPVLLLTTTGRKSGKRRTTPLLYVEDGDTIGIIASKGGAPKHPAWYGNLRSNPDVDVQIGAMRRNMRAHVAEGEERERVWAAAVAVYPPYADYQTRTSRTIPVIVLEPADR